MIGWIVIAVTICNVIYEIRDSRKKEFLAKLMDCTYLCIYGKDYYIPKK